MSLWHLVFREIRHRKLHAILNGASVAVATACLVGALVILKANARHTENVLADKRRAVEEAGAELEDAMRKITKGLGFNVIILPEDQNLQEMHLTGAVDKTMPEAYVERLARSDIVTVNHLLPTITKKLTWPEKELPIILYGTRGEVPLAHRDPKKPLLDAVPAGSMIVGYHIAETLALRPGKEVDLMGRPFTIAKVHEERGSIDDSTVWINLKEAQEMLGLQNLIHAIQALECHCAGDRITEIRREIGAILPGTQVIERGSPALARAEARSQAKVSAEEALARESASRRQLQRQQASLATATIPVAAIGSALLMGFMTLTNVRQRRPEIAILSALGLRSRQILGVFLGKALLTGMAGGLVGFGVGVGVGIMASDAARVDQAWWRWLDGFTVTLALGLALGVAVLGSWIPAIMASRQDAATILHQD